MKIDSQETYVVENGLGLEQSRFSISVSPKIFDILSNSLYSDKIGSIVRELCSNCYDSHVMAGKASKPFEIVLPSKGVYELDPVVVFRDFGTGISENDIYGIYTSYGVSNKTTSNDVIGSWGLGAKSPFAYTKQFTIISSHDGIKSTYLAFIDEEGYPAITKVSDELVETSNGFQVHIPVKEQDIGAFVTAIYTQLEYFDPFPIIRNLPEKMPEPKKPKVLFEGTNWKVYDNNTFVGEDLHVVVGNISYGCYLSETMFPSNICKFVGLFKRNLLEFRFNIGDLELSASRESLQMSKKTVDAITSAVIICAVEFFNRLAESKKELIKVGVMFKGQYWYSGGMVAFLEKLRDLSVEYGLNDLALEDYRGIDVNKYQDFVKITLFGGNKGYPLSKARTLNLCSYEFNNSYDSFVKQAKQSSIIDMSRHGYYPLSMNVPVLYCMDGPFKRSMLEYLKKDLIWGYFITPKKSLRTQLEIDKFMSLVQEFAEDVCSSESCTKVEAGTVVLKLKRARSDLSTNAYVVSNVNLIKTVFTGSSLPEHKVCIYNSSEGFMEPGYDIVLYNKCKRVIESKYCSLLQRQP